MSCTFYKGDCLEKLKQIPDSSIQLILWDPPFGTTKNVWDSKLNWKEIFPECFRVLKETGMLVIFSSIPFNYTLIREAPKPPSYSWYWNKKQITCPLIANHQPVRCVEEILVWKNKKNFYNRIQIGEEERKGHTMTPTSYYGKAQPSKDVIRKGKTRSHYIEALRENDGFSTRPRELVKLLIETYSNPGDKILDPTCYKGLSGVVAKELKRNWIGIDKYFYPTKIISSQDKLHAATLQSECGEAGKTPG